MLTFVRRPLTPEGATLVSRGVVLEGSVPGQLDGKALRLSCS